VSFGIDSVWFHHYYYDSDQYNVVATVVGTVKPDKLIVVGGHYDSVVYGGGNPYTWAPGADDNGSGTVATLEMARIIAQHPLPVTVMFVPFAQEEQGLIGSDYFAAYLQSQGADLHLMINADMIGHNLDAHTGVKIYADPTAIEFVNTMIIMGDTYTNLTTYYAGQSSGSDHYSFYQYGYDAVFSSEGDFFSNGWHQNSDIVDSLDFGYMKEVVRLDLASLVTVARSIGYRIGDANTDGFINITDVVFLINHIFIDGPSPDPFSRGDVTCDGQITVEDVVFLINHLFIGGPPPPDSC
jgi:Zn-dependent M28 family amino/carboxypeptidase